MPGISTRSTGITMAGIRAMGVMREETEGETEEGTEAAAIE